MCFLQSFDIAEKRHVARQEALESPTTDVLQLQAKIRSIVFHTIEAQKNHVDANELLHDLVADLCILSAL